MNGYNLLMDPNKDMNLDDDGFDDFDTSFKNIGSFYDLQMNAEGEEGDDELDDKPNIDIITNNNNTDENSNSEEKLTKVPSSKDLFSNYFWNERNYVNIIIVAPFFYIIFIFPRIPIIIRKTMFNTRIMDE